MTRAARTPILHRAGWTDGLSTRTANALRSAGIDSRAALAAMPPHRLRSLPALGAASMLEIDHWLGRSAASAGRPRASNARAASTPPIRLTVRLDPTRLRHAGASAVVQQAVTRAVDTLARELARLLETEGGTDPPPAWSPIDGAVPT